MWLIAAQVMLSAFYGFIIGVERQLHGSNAGVRTCSLVCMGACLFAITSTHAFGPAFYHSVADPTRIAAQIVSGVGFLCGGVIFRDSNNTRGLTTAAIIWVCAAVGVSIAFEMFAIASLVMVLCVMFLTMNRWPLFKKYLGQDRGELIDE